MANPIRMPMPGQMTEECTVLQWFKAEGDTVSKGDPLFEIETDKSNMEIEAFDEGTLLRIDALEGATVPVESIVAWIGQPGEELPEPAPAEPAPVSAPAAPSAPATEAAATPAPATAAEPGPVSAPAAPAPAATAGGKLKISPRASRVAAELGVDPRTVSGTGPGGRIVERDVRAAAEQAVPGPAAAEVAAAPPSPAGAPVAAPPAPVNVDGEGEPLSRMRQTIARRLTENTSVPTFTVTVAVDMTDLLAYRAQLKAAGSEISVTDFIHVAVVQALGEFPLLNASTDGVRVWRHEHVHLGVAVSVPAGLLVPVVREADMLSVKGLHDKTAQVVTAARDGALTPDALTGSTFSVSNMGMFGVEQFTAIINPGESGILAVSSVSPEVRPHGGGMAVRQMMRITLTADHRLVDGTMGADFANAVKRRLEDADGFRNQVPIG
ncbi:MAG: dihydrolipoamide acetyltransferase family protein [Chloroflexota bacterium]|jgi:pyruvate dehydrogenase E2 component (dihydrolipoamide acetyltransferase)